VVALVLAAGGTLGGVGGAIPVVTVIRVVAGLGVIVVVPGRGGQGEAGALGVLGGGEEHLGHGDRVGATAGLVVEHRVLVALDLVAGGHAAVFGRRHRAGPEGPIREHL